MSQSESSAVNPYPRTYRASPILIPIYVFVASTFFVPGLLRFIHNIRDILIVFLIFMSIILFFMRNLIFAKVVIFADRIQKVSGVDTVVLRKDQILGYRPPRDSNWRAMPIGIVLLVKPEFVSQVGMASVALPRGLRTDAVWDEWFSKIPNLDRDEEARFREQIQTDQGLGATPEARIRLWQIGRVIAWALWGATVVLTGLLLSEKFVAAATLGLILIPWITLGALGGPLHQLFHKGSAGGLASYSLMVLFFSARFRASYRRPLFRLSHGFSYLPHIGIGHNICNNGLFYSLFDKTRRCRIWILLLLCRAPDRRLLLFRRCAGQLPFGQADPELL